MVADADLPVWSFRPNWAEDVIERLAWKTNVFGSRVGSEQRVSLRLSPRRSFEYTCLLTRNDRSYFAMALDRLGGGEWMLPLWHDPAPLTAAIASGVSSLPCVTAYREFEAGGMAFIQGPDALTFEAVTIDSVGPTAITLAGATTLAWPRGTKVFPMRRAWIPNSPANYNRKTSGVATATIQFEVTRANDWSPTIVQPSYAGLPLLAQRPNEIDDLDYAFNRNMEELDNDSGLRSRVDRALRAFPSQQYAFALRGRQQHSEFRSLLYSLEGRRAPLWVPTYNDDFMLALPADSGDTFIEVEQAGYGYVGGPACGRQYLHFEMRDGTTFQRKVSSLGVTVADREKLNLNAALPVDLTPANVMRISFMTICRLDQDEVEIAHVTDSNGAASCTVVFRAAPDTRVADPDTFVPIPEATMSDDACGVVIGGYPLWRMRINGTELPQLIGDFGDHTFTELRFMTPATVGAGTQPGGGTGFASEYTGVSGTPADVFDGSQASWWRGLGSDCWISYQFFQPWEITHVLLRARDAPYQYQSPRSFFIERSNDEGATWGLEAYGVAEKWTSGATQVFELATLYPDQDLSALDEPGGYRYYAFRITEPTFEAGSTASFTQIKLLQDTVDIGQEHHRVWHAGMLLPLTAASIPFDGSADPDTYFMLSADGGYLMVDFGYKRVVDEIAVTYRNHADGVQGPAVYDVLAGNTAFDIDDMTLLVTIDHSASNPPGGGTTFIDGVP